MRLETIAILTAAGLLFGSCESSNNNSSEPTTAPEEITSPEPGNNSPTEDISANYFDKVIIDCNSDCIPANIGVYRSNGMGGKVLRMQDGEKSKYVLDGFEPGAKYIFNVRYSNDEYLPSTDTIRLRVNNKPIGSFLAKDTGDGGHGWNNFFTSEGMSFNAEHSGPYTVELSCNGGTVEVDTINVKKR